MNSKEIIVLSALTLPGMPPISLKQYKEQYNRYRCVSCSCTLQPGKAGRKCKECRTNPMQEV